MYLEVAVRDRKNENGHILIEYTYDDTYFSNKRIIWDFPVNDPLLF